MPIESSHDPRTVLVRRKYFSLRPKPLERWLWAQRVSPAAERVFWLHWQEGLQRGDWCSEIPLRRVAQECCVDLSTVTKAYQLLSRLGCLRRTDPGRDPANPFQQATAVTEVRVPRELLVELDRHPDRRTEFTKESAKSVHQSPVSALAAPSPILAAAAVTPSDPFAGLRGRERVRALAQLTNSMSAAEQGRYREAQGRVAQMSFDSDSRLSPEEQGRILQLLSVLSRKVVPTAVAIPAPGASDAKGPRSLSMFELARLRREIQAATSSASASELLRQVIWSIEEGPLQRFAALHALNIALKKIREGAWTRPHRMPPNWTRAISVPADLETCRRA
jgi:hypothetical protein